MRIGKLERWILTHAYLKTAKHELPYGWKYPRGYKTEKENDRYFNFLFKSEVLLNYFKDLRLSSKEAWAFGVREKFRTTKEYKGALASYSRTVGSMGKKDYIEVWIGVDGDWTGIVLTDIGKRIAESFLKVNS